MPTSCQADALVRLWSYSVLPSALLLMHDTHWCLQPASYVTRLKESCADRQVQQIDEGHHREASQQAVWAPVVGFGCTTEVTARRWNDKGIKQVNRRRRREYMLCCLTLFSSEDNSPSKSPREVGSRTVSARGRRKGGRQAALMSCLQYLIKSGKCFDFGKYCGSI